MSHRKLDFLIHKGCLQFYMSSGKRKLSSFGLLLKGKRINRKKKKKDKRPVEGEILTGTL